ncbi:MAG: hypothetical protein JXJ30_11055 [Halothiobacillaceae bacterium]|nr:hypothetical protein [Halothiobacillaceae bacterium]
MGERQPKGQALTALLARQDIWRGRQIQPGTARAGDGFPSGWSELDGLLGGGWPREGLVELYADTPSARSDRRPLDRLERRPLLEFRDWFQASLGHGLTDLLLPWIAALSRAGRVALINPPARPCVERWREEGVSLENLLLVRPRDLRELGWATEEVLQAGVHPLVVSWMPPLGFALRRRLKLAAESGRACLVTPYPGPSCQSGQSGNAASPAGLQLAIRRETDSLLVHRHKPFHPHEVRLELTTARPAQAAEHGRQTRPGLPLAMALTVAVDRS